MWLFSGVCWDLWGRLGWPHRLPRVLAAGEPPFSVWFETPLLHPSSLHSALGIRPSDQSTARYQMRSFALCPPPVCTVFMELKPAPFSFLPFCFSACGSFHISTFSPAAFGGGRGGRGDCFPHILPLSPSSLCRQKQLPALCGFSLPQFTSLRLVPTEFCGSGWATCCVNPQISFRGVQDGFVLTWLHVMDARRKENFHALLPSWPLPPHCLFCIVTSTLRNCRVTSLN